MKAVYTVHGQSFHKCDICDNIFSTHYNLNKHVRVVHEQLKNKLRQSCVILRHFFEVFNRPSVAGAVLQSPQSLIN
jgi:uncharacterized C2H2 Zn-finger protein